MVVRASRPLLPGSVLEEIVRIERLVTQEFVCGAVQRIAAGLDADVDNRARTAVEFGCVIVSLDAKFLSCIHGRDQAGRVDQEHRDGRAINEDFVRVGHAAVGRKISPPGEAARCRVLFELRLRADAGCERHQSERITAVER